MDKTVLNALCDKVDEQLGVWEVSCLPLGIAKDGEVLLSAGFGCADGESTPCNGQTMFQIGSCSKAFTARTAITTSRSTQKRTARYSSTLSAMRSR